MELIRNQIGDKNPNYKHGYKGTKLYHIWTSMKDRCLNQECKKYKDYGGRGIIICDEWLNFIPFKDWSLSNGYAENLTIDRKENALGYSPNNCRFVISKINSQNRRTTKLNVQKANEIRCLYKTNKYTQKELAEKYNVSQTQISKIVLNHQWVSND